MIIKKDCTILFLFLLTVFQAVGQVPTPAGEQEKSVLLMNGTAHLGNGKMIENSLIGFKDGKLNLVADALTTTVDVTLYDTVIKVQGKHIYPGFIAPNSTLGLQEIGAVRATRDYAETGLFNPYPRTIIAYNTDSKITPTVRTNGVLLAQITPRSGVIAGTSSVVELDGWNWEDAVYRMDDGIHLYWPTMIRRTGWWAEPGGLEENKKYRERVGQIEQFFKDAKAYLEQVEHEEKNLKFQSMEGVFNGSKTLYVHADFVKEIQEIINFSSQYKIGKLVIVGGYDSWMLTDILKEKNVAVMLKRVHDLPERPEDDIDLPYKLPSILHKEGVMFCLQNAGSMEQMATRNLPFYAGTAVAYGLPYEEAVRSITLNAAKILGVDKTVGSLEPGKDATLFVSEGDALDMRTNNIELAFIQGVAISLMNHQKDLYLKFKGK